MRQKPLFRAGPTTHYQYLTNPSCKEKGKKREPCVTSAPADRSCYRRLLATGASKVRLVRRSLRKSPGGQGAKFKLQKIGDGGSRRCPFSSSSRLNCSRPFRKLPFAKPRRRRRRLQSEPPPRHHHDYFRGAGASGSLSDSSRGRRRRRRTP